MMQTPRAHRPAPGPIAVTPPSPAQSDILQSLQTLRAITTRYDEDAAATSGSPRRPQSSHGTPRAPPSARKFVYVQNPSPRNQTFVVQKAAGSSKADHRPSREMGVSTVRTPHAQPWFRPQLDETMTELERSRREVLKLKEVVASIAKERDAAFESGRRAAEVITQKVEEARQLSQRLAAAEEELRRERFSVAELIREREAAGADATRLKGRCATLASELDALKGAMGSYLEERIRAEQSSAVASVTAAQARAEAQKAALANDELVRERDHAQAVAAAAERERAERAARRAPTRRRPSASGGCAWRRA